MNKRFFNVILPRDEKSAVAILLYGGIGSGENRVDSSAVVAELMDLASRYENIDVRINSMGGEVYAGMAIFNAIRASQANINIYVDGVAASMAGVIALCGRPLHMSKYARLMLHQVSGGIYGTSKDIRSYADQVDALTNVLVDVVAEKSGLKPEEVREKWFDGEDHWITAQEAMDLKLADSIYDMKDGAVPAEGATAEAIYEFTNRLKSQPKTDINMAIIDELKKRSSFQNATTEDQVLAKVTELENAAAKVPALQNRVEELEKKEKEATMAARNAFLDQAVADGRIQASQKDKYLNLMAHDEQGVKDLINSLSKGSGMIKNFLGGTNGGNNGNGSARQQLEAMSWDEIDKAERLMELKNNYPDLYEAKMKAKFNA